MQTAAFDAEVHHAFIDQVRRAGCAPGRREVAAALARPVKDIEQALHRLSASHGVVLHPHVCEPWVIHPFSLSPTATWVQQGERGWWALAPHGTTSTIFAPPFYPSGKRPMFRRGASDTVFLPDPLCRFPRFKCLGGNGTGITAIETGVNGPLPRQ